MPQPGIDLAEFAAIASPKSGCWFSRLSDEQKAKVNAAKDAGYSARVIATVVTDWGIAITRAPVGNHFSPGHTCG